MGGRKTIQERIAKAVERKENSLNLSFPIEDVKNLCDKFGLNPSASACGDLTNRIIGHFNKTL